MIRNVFRIVIQTLFYKSACQSRIRIFSIFILVILLLNVSRNSAIFFVCCIMRLHSRKPSLFRLWKINFFLIRLLWFQLFIFRYWFYWVNFTHISCIELIRSFFPDILFSSFFSLSFGKLNGLQSSFTTNFINLFEFIDWSMRRSLWCSHLAYSFKFYWWLNSEAILLINWEVCYLHESCYWIFLSVLSFFQNYTFFAWYFTSFLSYNILTFNIFDACIRNL